MLAAGPRLVTVGRLGVGLDNIDLDACAERSVSVYPATGANVIAVAEYVIAATLMMLRGAYRSTDRVLAGEWPRTALTGREASGRTLGIVGFGAIGRAVAQRAMGLGVRVAAFDPLLAADDPAWQAPDVRRFDDLRALLGVCDVVTLHVPLSDATRHLLGAAEIAAMKPGACIVNTARGGVLDEAAMAQALVSGKLRAAALDVFEDEPLPAHSRLEGIPNLYLTPHIAGLTEEANARTARSSLRGFGRLSNRPPVLDVRRTTNTHERSCCHEHSQLPDLGGVHHHQLCGTARVAPARAGDAVVHGA